MPALLDSSLPVPGESSSRKRKLAAILHADVAGFSRLMGEDEDGTHRVLGELRSAVDALNCAVEMQRAARAINDPLPPERRLELRIGVNLGDVIVDGENIFGDGVNIAARLQALAKPGKI